MKAFQVEVYIQQRSHDEQEAKFMYGLALLVWLEMTLGMYLSAGGWLYL